MVGFRHGGRATREGILKILAIIGGVLMLVVFIGWVLVRKIAGLLNPPLRVHLVPDPAGGGCSRKAIDRYRSELEPFGFEEIGTFRIPEIKGLVLTAFVQKYQEVCAVVYDHPLAGCYIDFFSENQRKSSLTVSNAPAGGELDTPPGRDKLIDKELVVNEMYDHLLRNRPSGPYKRIDESNFVEEFQAAYAEEMDWRMNRGGVTEEEVRRSAEIMIVESEKAIQRTTQKIQSQYAEKQRILPCEIDARGDCPYEYKKNPERDIEGMPFAEGDARSCPKYGHVCPEFMDDFGLTPEELNIRASIHCGAVLDQMLDRGSLTEDSPEYRLQKKRYEDTLRMYPRDKYPQYY